VAHEKPVTQVELVKEFAAAAGKKAEIVHVPRAVIEGNGGNVFQEPLYFGQYYDLPPITEVVDRVTRVLKVEPTPFEAGLRETYRWYLDRAEQRHPDFSFEDKLIREAKAA
jgi:nucleoside-diphosphate-sugar epimerase